jgi:hypothetical protein
MNRFIVPQKISDLLEHNILRNGMIGMYEHCRVSAHNCEAKPKAFLAPALAQRFFCAILPIAF